MMYSFWSAELDVDVRWAGEPDVLLKLEPSTKWITNAVKIGTLNLTRTLPLQLKTVVCFSPVLCMYGNAVSLSCVRVKPSSQSGRDSCSAQVS